MAETGIKYAQRKIQFCTLVYLLIYKNKFQELSHDDKNCVKLERFCTVWGLPAEVPAVCYSVLIFRNDIFKFPKFCFILFICMCICLSVCLCLCEYMLHVCRCPWKTEEGSPGAVIIGSCDKDAGNWTRSFGRTAIALNHWAIHQAS